MIYKIPDKKIFAGSAKSGELVEFPDIERGWGVTENTGFVPPMEYFNGAFNRVDNALMYLLQNGVSSWDKDLEYPIGALVQLEGEIYLCKQQHTNQNPQQHADYWKDLTDFYTKAENDENFAAKNHNHDEIYLKKDEASDGTPIGVYLAWSSQEKIPAGYLLCDGRSLKKSEYNELFAVIGYTYGGSGDDFNIPKFNDGRFMRGTGGNAAALGVLQNDEIKEHNHYVWYGNNETELVAAGNNSFGKNPRNDGNTRFRFSTTNAGGIETRPLNSAVVFIIKAKNVREAKQGDIDKTPYATETKAGIIKVKNEITGQQEDVAVSEKAVVGIASIGINQTWQDMTSQRQPNVTYTNTTGRSIFVLVRDASASGNGRNYEFYVDGVNICPGSSVNTTSILHLFAIIPPNSKYKAVVGAPFKWYELR